MGLIGIDYRSRIPIYEQLVENIRELVIKGLIKENEFLPSVRSLASELGINPNTIQKAYSELERKNIICTIPGKGSMVCSDSVSVSEEQKKIILSEFRECVKKAKDLNISRDELIAAVDSGLRGDIPRSGGENQI